VQNDGEGTGETDESGENAHEQALKGSFGPRGKNPDI
jgi:hypothetical protein